MLRLLSPVYLVPLLLNRYMLLFLGAAVLAALTDWADGVLARRWGCPSEGGAQLDIYADKVLCATLMGAGLGLVGGWALYVPICVLSLYHIVVVIMRVVGNLLFQPSRVAKLKMFVEMPSLICASAVIADFDLSVINELGVVAVWGAAGLATWSWFHYLGIAPDWPERFYPRITV